MVFRRSGDSNGESAVGGLVLISCMVEEEKDRNACDGDESAVANVSDDFGCCHVFVVLSAGYGEVREVRSVFFIGPFRLAKVSIVEALALRFDVVVSISRECERFAFFHVDQNQALLQVAFFCHAVLLSVRRLNAIGTTAGTWALPIPRNRSIRAGIP